MSKLRFDRLSKRLEQTRQQLLDQMAEDAAVYFRTVPFTTRGWEGRKWKRRKDRLPHPLLEKTGRMRASIRKLRGGGMFSRDYRIVGSDVRYAKYHNAGSGRLPVRQFIGDSRALHRHFIKLINRGLSKV